MSHVMKRYKLLKELPMYPAGTVVTHEYDVLPSQYLDRQGNSQTYATDGKWFVVQGDHTEVMAPQFLESLVRWCATSQREDTKGWVETL